MHRWGNKKDMAGDDPPFLAVGTEVSAKYKGAFCEAKIRKVVKAVKCKVQYKNESGSVFVSDEQIKGFVVAGASVEVKLPDKKDYIEGTIIKIQDLSQYTVVFDDGDIATLRRTALCLKSGRHFAEGETLDQLPLTHPEHFSTPVVSGVRGSRRRDEMEENSDDESKRERKIEREEDMGKVVCVEISDKKKSKDNWFPGLIVAPNAQDSVKIDVEDEYLVRSFKDGRYYTVPKRETTEFTRDLGAKVDIPTLKMAVEKAISFLDKDDLPPHWDRDVLFGMTDYTSESDGSDTDSTDDEPREEKDHFVAQLYKFMDDRGTPINKGPMISSRDVDLYKLFKIVNKLGGYNRVTNRNQWKSVTIKLAYGANQTNSVKTSYKKYLHNFEDFYRKLGCTMLSHNTNKLRSRSSRPLIRDRDKSLLEKNAEKEENYTNVDESPEGRELQNGVKTKLEGQVKDVTETDDKQKELKKDAPKVKKETNVENVKDDDKVKKTNPKLDNFATVKDMLQAAPAIAPKEIKVKPGKSEDVKDEKVGGEKKSERKVVKPIQKLDINDCKKSDKPSIKTKTTKLKGVEKRLKKNENVVPGIRMKRSLKERMKAIVNRLKLKSGVSSSEQDKKKQKSADDANKGSPQLYKIKTKEEILNNGTKARKLSVGNDGKNGNGSGNGDRKSTSSSTSGGNTSDGGNSTGTIGRSRRNDDDSSEGSNPKKKTYTRRKKDDDKSSSNSSDSLINQSIEIVSPHKTICIGDKLKVYYGPTHESKVTYEAKVMNKRYGAVTEYFVHYTGWNTRYDEWIRRSRIADDLSWTPARDKLKFSQNDAQVNSQPPSQVDQQMPPNQNAKIVTEKTKRSSISPVGKIRSKSVTKIGVRPGRTAKSKSPTKDTKMKKTSASKDSDSSDDSDNESNQKQQLQKTRSRTEKQKQQDEDTSSKDGKDTEPKSKKPPPLKRTRSGSLKLESKEEPVKKRKVTPAKVNKTSRANAIRNSIMKNLVPRKRMAEKGKKLFKKKNQSSKERDNFESKDIDKLAESLDVERIDDAESHSDDEQDTESTKGKSLEEIEKINCKETELILEIKPFPAPSAIIEETDVSLRSETDKVEVTEMREMNADEVDEAGPPVLKKEILSDDDATGVPCSTTQFLADSYLAENIEKPKVVKTKTKKEIEEKSPPSASKIFNRNTAGGSDKSAKANCDVKEKTFFTSRIDKLETKKNDNTDKDKKDTKIRNVSTFTSYLCMDKIDSIRKVNHLEKTPEKNSDKPALKPGEDDIYEFKEPEPFEFRGIDDRTILHRRPTSRIFDEVPFKRVNKVASSPNDSGKDDEDSKATDESDTGSLVEGTMGEGEPDTEKSASEVAECENKKKTDINVSPKTKEDVSPEVKAIERAVEKLETMPETEAGEKVDGSKTIRVSSQMGAEVVAKEVLKIDSTVEPSLFNLQCEDEDDDEDMDEAKLIISESDQLADNTTLSESVTSKILGAKVNEVSVVFREFDDDEKTPDLDRFTSQDKGINSELIESPVEKAKKLKPSSSKPANKSVSPGKKDENTVAVSEEKLFDEQVLEKLRADENLDSDDESISSAKSSTSSADKDVIKGSDDSDSGDKDDEYLSSDSTSAIAIEHLTVKKQDTLKTYSADSSSSAKKKATVEMPKVGDEMEVDTSCNDLSGDFDVNETLIHHSVIDEVEIEIFTAAKKEAMELAEAKNITDTEKDAESLSDKASKEENKKDEDDNDGLLLCEETIPKSPETKDTSCANDTDVPYPGGSGITNETKKLPEKNVKLKRGPRSSAYSAAATVFENTPPTTPEGSTAGNSPSDEHNGFSSTSFSLNEKPALNKDSSENDTYSDNSERSLRTKRFRDESGTYHKKNSYDYDSYLKRKSDYKNDEPSKKKIKPYGPASANESEKDEFSDEGNSPKSTTSSQKFTKSSYYVELDPDLDPNQRIEVLESKLQELRKAYLSLKQELSSIDKRRKKLRRREREGRMMTRNEANSLL